MKEGPSSKPLHVAVMTAIAFFCTTPRRVQAPLLLVRDGMIETQKREELTLTVDES